MPANGDYPEDPPLDGVVEVSLFGPGVGECVVVHVGAQRWVVIDSCRSERGRPVALEYLEAMGVPSTAICRVLATHWHDDHIRGLAQVVEAAPGSPFFCSGALQREEFLKLIAASGPVRRTTKLGSGVDEMTDILGHLRSRGVQPTWASQIQIMLREEATLTCLTTLSPSARTLTRGFLGFVGLTPKLRGALKIVPSLAPNETSVVLHIQAGRAVILLGADLEVTASANAGWHAIVASTERPVARASVYKIAHHGSKNGDTPGIWNTLLSERPLGILTPFASSHLPTNEDLERIRTVVGRLFQTARALVQPIKRHGAVERIIKMTAKKRPVPRRGKMGQVRLRLNKETGELVSAETFGAAFEVPAPS